MKLKIWIFSLIAFVAAGAGAKQDFTLTAISASKQIPKTPGPWFRRFFYGRRLLLFEEFIFDGEDFFDVIPFRFF